MFVFSDTGLKHGRFVLSNAHCHLFHHMRPQVSRLQTYSVAQGGSADGVAE